MPEIKNWLYEFIQPEDIKAGEIAEFVSIPKIDEDAEFESITATILYKTERRKININKGNGKALAMVFSTNTDLWHHKKFTLHLPESPEEKRSRMKYIITPYIDVAVSELKPPTREQTIAALIEKGVSKEQIVTMIEIGAIK